MRGFRIGRLFGIDLRVDWSWMLIFTLIAWNLFAVFTRWHPAWSGLEAMVVAGCAALVFFACIVLHEMAHSLVAKAYGVHVRSITLFLFGGVSDIEHEPPSAVAELLMAIVGPLTSIGLGIAALVIGSLGLAGEVVKSPADAVRVFAQVGPIETLLLWLGPINILIGLFNMIPGFPLDGGRVFRSLVWAITGDFRRATRVASAGGSMMGWLFIVSGIAMTFGMRIPFFGTGLVSGIWLAFIGWFLHSAALQETSRLALDDALAGLRVGQLMQRDPPVIAPTASIASLVREHLVTSNAHAVPVVESGRLVGLVSISDVRQVAPETWETTTVGAVMRDASALLVTRPDERLAEAFERLAVRDVEQLPVMAGGTLVGMLRRRDVTRWLELAWKPGAAPAPLRHRPA